VTSPKLAPNKLVRYRWTSEDQGLVRQQPAADQKPTPSFSVTPYGLNPKDQRKVKELASGTEKSFSQLKEGDAIMVSLSYSNAWFPFRATRFFDDAYAWEKTPGGIKGKTIGELCQALFKSDPARYVHYDPAQGRNPDEAWQLFDHWEHTDLRWAFLKSGKFARNMDPFTIPTEVADPIDRGKTHRISWVLYKAPRVQIVVAAPTPQGAAEAVQRKTTVPLQVTLDDDSWRFKLVKDQVMAVAVGEPKYAELADGSLGKGNAKPWDTVDVTPLFPAWVKLALSAQVKTGYVPVQPDPTEEPTGYHGSKHDLGYGNCHGFTAKLFQLFDDEALKSWKSDAEGGSDAMVSSPPEGAPTKVQQADPRYQHVEVAIDQASLNKTLQAHGKKYKLSNAYPPQWTAVVDVGKSVFVQRVVAAGGAAVKPPRFGDLGIASVASTGAKDHSVIALGLAASTQAAGAQQRVYTLQKIGPMSPYAIIAWKVTNYDWYRFPNGIARGAPSRK